MPHVQLEQTVFDFAIREINALERRIVTAEDDADAMLWEQARQVCGQLDGGLSQVKLAAQWINVRNHGEPYSRRHVQIVQEIVTCYSNSTPRPRFRDLYNEITNATRAHVAHNSGNNEWYTPKDYIAAARAVLGEIDLDPATSLDAQAEIHATTFYTVEQNGLAQPWHGRVWLNTPHDGRCHPYEHLPGCDCFGNPQERNPMFPPEPVRIGGFDYTANPDGSVSRTDWRDDQSRARVNEILSRERLFNALTEALTRADAAEQALRDVAAHVHALFPMDSPGPAPGHEASFIIHTTNHMNDSRRAASLQEIQRRDGVGAAEALRRQAFNQAHGLRDTDAPLKDEGK